MNKTDFAWTLKFAAAAVGAWWADLGAIVRVLLIMIGIDMASGLVRAFGEKKLNSDASRKGAAKKAMMLLITWAAHVAGTHFAADHMGVSLPIGAAVALFYVVQEAISITENAVGLGLPVPTFLTKALEKSNTSP